MHLLRMPAPILLACLGVAAIVAIVLLAQPWSTDTSAGAPEVQGDTDCDEDVDSVDALWVLQDVAGIANGAKCVRTAGDTDCSGDLGATDGLHILRFTAGLPNEAPEACTPVGDTLPAETPAPTESPPLTPTPKGMTPTPKGQTPTPTVVGPTPTPTETPTSTPTGTDPHQTVTPTPTPTPMPTTPSSPTPVPVCYEPLGPGRASRPVVGSGAPPVDGYTLARAVSSFDSDYDLPIEFRMIPGSSDQAIVALQKAHEVWRVSLSNSFQPVLYADFSTDEPDGFIPSTGNGGGEEGLLSVAFSPDFATDHLLYVYFTNGNSSDTDQPTELGRVEVESNFVDNATYERIIQIPDTQNNHNGGRIVFQENSGADGCLYLSLGDGGGSGDQGNHAQNLNDLRGKVIRLDVSGDGPGYNIPPDNPFVNRPGRDEIWACGFRNPWRMSADRLTGDLWLGDVGQGSWEEVDRVVRGGNFGWRCYEGNAPYNLTGCPSSSIMTFPRAAYPNEGPPGNQAVSGGLVYRGSAMPELYGWYIYGDAYSGRIWAVNTSDSSAPVRLMDTDHFISSFGELPNGEIVVVTFDDALYTIEPN